MPTGIVSLGSNVTIAILLHETAVALIVYIRTLETFAVLIFLYGGSVALTVLVFALELRAVGIPYDTLAMGLSVLEHTLYGVAALLRQLSASVLFVGLPLSYVGVAVLPGKGALSVLVTVLLREREIGHICIACFLGIALHSLLYG